MPRMSQVLTATNGSPQTESNVPQEFRPCRKCQSSACLTPPVNSASLGKRVNVLWQHTDLLVFMARGREYRSEFHINPSDEMMYPVKGDLKLHYRTEDGKEEIAEVPEGSVIYTPAGTPHSPRFAPMRIF